jgi:hypothetical protein
MAPKTTHTITILIPPGATDVKIDVDGVKGKACTDITKTIEDALGGDVTSRKKKPEFFDKETHTEKIKAGH